MLFPCGTSAHSGNTDSYGGHKKKSNGTYHCHSGQCLENARQKEYEYYFPFGQKDGLTGTDQTEEIRGYMYNNIDSDQAEYRVPYALRAYKAGYENTFVPPTFREKYGWYIEVSSILAAGLFVLGFMNIGGRVLSNKKPPTPIRRLSHKGKGIR